MACDEGAHLRKTLGRYGFADLIFDHLDGNAALARRINWCRTRARLVADRERSLGWLRCALEGE